ncbi:MAG: hypothetical protein DI548_14100, partial [Flavobacterium johnsoniae]
MKIKEVISVIETMAPLAYAEDFDNVGLLTGNPEDETTGILVCHDALENVIDEAISKKCNMVVCFHPILFSGLKKITGKNYVERAVLKAIKNDALQDALMHLGFGAAVGADGPDAVDLLPGAFMA